MTWSNPLLQPGEPRRAVGGIPGKTGVVYHSTPKTGEFLCARPTVAQKSSTPSTAGATGAVQVQRSKGPKTVFVVRWNPALGVGDNEGNKYAADA